MFDTRNTNSKGLHRLVDFVVVGVTFYTACVLLSVDLRAGLFVHILAYSMILLAFVRLSKRAITYFYKSVGESTRQILGNAIGILIGTCTMLLFEKLFAYHSDLTVVIFLSSVTAFFVLGTFSPLTHINSLGHK